MFAKCAIFFFLFNMWLLCSLLTTGGVQLHNALSLGLDVGKQQTGCCVLQTTIVI